MLTNDRVKRTHFFVRMSILVRFRVFQKEQIPLEYLREFE